MDFWNGVDKTKNRLYFLVVILSNLCAVGFLVLLNAWTSNFYNALQNYNSSAFMISMRDFILLGMGFIAIRVYGKYIQQLLELRWRCSLTESFLAQWLAKKKYFYLEQNKERTDNPDQRIAEDINLYVTKTMKLLLGSFDALIKIISFGVILWRLSGKLEFTVGGINIMIPGYLFFIAVIYAICGTYLADKIGNPLINLNYKQQKREADFRRSAISVRENADSIALYDGEKVELTKLEVKFSEVAANYLGIIKRNRKLAAFSEGYAQFTFIFPFMVAAPKYFIEKSPMGTLVQTATAFDQVQRSLSYFISCYGELAEWSAACGRIIDFHKQLADLDKQVVKQHQQGEELLLKDLTISLPNGETLLNVPLLELKPGERIYITGANGQGKSVFAKVLKGIWPSKGETILIPQELMILPQTPYLFEGTLKEQLCYADGKPLENVEAEQLLMQVGLEKYVSRLNTRLEWHKLLSGGEKQLIVLAQILHKKPRWLLLDEPTAALSKSKEEYYYDTLVKALPETGIITISHSKQLEKYHSNRYLVKDGKLAAM